MLRTDERLLEVRLASTLALDEATEAALDKEDEMLLEVDAAAAERELAVLAAAELAAR